MKLYAKYATDAQAENEGTWIDLGDGAKIKVARIGCKPYRDAYARLSKPYAAQIKAGTLPDETQEALLIEAIAETILLDWSGFEGEDGQTLPYSRDSAVKVLTELRDFRNQVTALALEQETFRKEALEEAAKNSVRASAGKSKADGTKTS